MTLTMAESRADLRTSEAAPGTAAAPTLAAADLPRLVETYADFVWRSLRRLGVSEAGTDDAVQQVFLVAQQRVTSIVVGKERSFLFAVGMNVAAHVRRAHARRREDLRDAPLETIDPAPLPDAELDQRRARALLDEVLDAMPLDLRTAFVLHELEEMTMIEIAEVLAIPPGTVASRLRRAREEFQKQAQRVRARVSRTGGHLPTDPRAESTPRIFGEGAAR